MHRFRLCCAPLALLLIASCANSLPGNSAVPIIPADLRVPCPPPSLRAASEGEYSDRVARLASAYRCTADRLTAVIEIIDVAAGE